MIERMHPARIVLATDMSVRCDRALARAARLAREWQCELVAVHVLDPAQVVRHERLVSPLPSWRRPEPWLASVQRRLAAELEAESARVTGKVILGRPDEAVLEFANRENADLVVLGVGHDEPLERIQLGSTIDRLVREASAPVLNVRLRARAPYRHVVIATDFSPASRPALLTASNWFPDAKFTLFHAVDPREATTGTSHAAEAAWRSAAEARCDRFLDDCDAGLQAREGQRLIEPGAPGTLLGDYLSSADVDLVVLGTHGRTGFRRAMLGSTAEALLHALDCDTLVVRSG